MGTKTMEGLVGARTNMNLLNTPFRVYKEARRKGDTETMERAMGYVNDYSDKVDEYKEKADAGMKEDAEAAREREKLEREKAIQKRREERAELERRMEESKENNDNKDNNSGVRVEISEDGKILLKENTMTGTMNTADLADLDSSGSNSSNNSNGSSSSASATSSTAVTNKEPVTYTKTGEVSSIEQTVGVSISVVV